MRLIKIIVAVIVVCAVAAVVVWWFFASTFFHFKAKPVQSGEHVVTLTGGGFVPPELQIFQSDTIVFRTSVNKQFWPASNSHPSHDIYPEFDPKSPLRPGNEWKFTFNRLGTWMYHDHIQHGFGGKIMVIEKGGVADSIPAVENCLVVARDTKMSCWDAQIKQTLNTDGLGAAFNAFIAIYNTEPEIPKSCHEWGHVLGEEAFRLHKAGTDIEYRKEMGYCGYGFFHGFMEKLIANDGDFNGAKEWCDSFVINDDDSAATRNCIHGIGHGSTSWLLEDEAHWGKFAEVAKLGTEVCESVLNIDDAVIRDCYDGVFNELYLQILNSLYGFSYSDLESRKNPFFYCQQQKDRYKESCYFEFVGMFYKLFDYDLSTAMKYVVNNVDDLSKRGHSVVAKLAADFIQFDIVKNDNSKNVVVCRQLPKFLFESCLGGIVNGFIQHGQPENMHARALTFCTADYLTPGERDYCHMKLLGQLRSWYAADKMKEVCSSVRDNFRVKYCSE